MAELSQRSAVLFQGQKAAPFLRSQWIAKGAAQPLTAAPILEPDMSAKPFFRSLWLRAFPTRRALPFGPLGRRDGTATDGFWASFT